MKPSAQQRSAASHRSRARPWALRTACCQLPIQGACKRTGAARVSRRHGVVPSVLAENSPRVFEGAAGRLAMPVRLPAGARPLREPREAPYKQPSRTTLHKVLRGPPDGESGTSAGCKTAVVRVCSPCRCYFATTWPPGPQIPRHVCTCENAPWFVGRMLPFSCCVAHSLCRLSRPKTRSRVLHCFVSFFGEFVCSLYFSTFAQQHYSTGSRLCLVHYVDAV